MVPPEMHDIVDEFYRPFVRPMGNLVIMCAQAEWALLQFVEQMAGDEDAAIKILNTKDHGNMNRDAR